MEKWTASSLIANLPSYNEDSSEKTRALTNFYVTLHMFGLQKGIHIEDLGPRCWEHAANYFMSRHVRLPYKDIKKVLSI